MADMEESLVMRRSKRSTAGNRMEVALAEFRAEDLGVDVEEDVDFVVVKDEEDAFESDFESTDEEANPEEVDAIAEKYVRDQERAVRKTGKSQLERVTAAAHARQKATFNPQAESATGSQNALSKPKRRVSLGVVIDAETGEVMERRKRQSQRRHTMMNTSETANRIRDAKEKRTAHPRKARVKIRPPTQDELIARALDMEEGNTIEHRDYLSLEEEKRKRARLVRTTVEGPLLRWVSKKEVVQVREEIHPTPTPTPMPAPVPPPYGYTYPPSSWATASTYTSSSMTSYLHPSASASQQLQYATPLPPSAYAYNPYISPPPPPPPPSAPTYVERCETVNKNYVVHEVEQSEKAPRIPWHSTMRAMFGDHAKWEEMRVYTTKGRPFGRPLQVCPITGKVGRYRDPRTNVPFANPDAYKTLTKILAHEYVWSDTLGCYVGHESDQPP